MDTYLIIYITAVFAICFTLGFALCRTFGAEAGIYLSRRFGGDETTYNSILRLFRIGYWLVHGGLGLLVVLGVPHFSDAEDVVRQVGLMVAGYAVVMAVYHYLLIRILYQVRV